MIRKQTSNSQTIAACKATHYWYLILKI